MTCLIFKAVFISKEKNTITKINIIRRKWFNCFRGAFFIRVTCAHALCATDKTSVSEAIRPRGRGAQKLNRTGTLMLKNRLNIDEITKSDNWLKNNRLSKNVNSSKWLNLSIAHRFLTLSFWAGEESRRCAAFALWIKPRRSKKLNYRTHAFSVLMFVCTLVSSLWWLTSFVTRSELQSRETLCDWQIQSLATIDAFWYIIIFSQLSSFVSHLY